MASATRLDHIPPGVRSQICDLPKIPLKETAELVSHDTARYQREWAHVFELEKKAALNPPEDTARYQREWPHVFQSTGALCVQGELFPKNRRHGRYRAPINKSHEKTTNDGTEINSHAPDLVEVKAHGKTILTRRATRQPKTPYAGAGDRRKRMDALLANEPGFTDDSEPLPQSQNHGQVGSTTILSLFLPPIERVEDRDGPDPVSKWFAPAPDPATKQQLEQEWGKLLVKRDGPATLEFDSRLKIAAISSPQLPINLEGQQQKGYWREPQNIHILIGETAVLPLAS